ncbi:MAG: membrane-bound lytic murein transglycosylase MltF [Thiobacillaceae bacterium]
MTGYLLPLLSRIIVLLAVAILHTGCSRVPDPPWLTGELVVLTRFSPTTYYFDADGAPTGFEYDLVRRFAAAQGWTVRFELAKSLEEMFSRLQRGEAHFAAAGLAATDKRLARMRFGPSYADSREWVVCGPLVRAPKRVADLVGLRIEVVAGSSYLDRLRDLRLEHPQLAWQEVELPGEEELLERVWSGLTDCTVADEMAYQIARNYLPGLQAGFDLGKPRRIAWAFPKRGETRLLEAVGGFFQEMTESRELEMLKERYFGHISRLAEADVLGILEKRTTRLPALRPHFFEGQTVSGIDWRLLAAVAYQESHWDPKAVSPTGVRGIMMLTADTADRLGVKDRLDARESILGGARYLRMLIDMIPDSVPEPDRTWMALAAYNIGPGHFAAALRLARRLERNPDTWIDVKDVLPKLSQARYAGTLTYGYARGGEARAFAENVRIYFDILCRYEQPYREGFHLRESVVP